MSMSLISSQLSMSRSFSANFGMYQLRDETKQDDDKSTKNTVSSDPEAAEDLNGSKPVENADPATDGIEANPRIQAVSREMGRAKERLIELAKDLKRVQKIWATQPEERARQVMRIAKELKQVLKDYVAAQKAYRRLVGEISSGGMSVSGISVGTTGSMTGAMGEARQSNARSSDAETAQAEAADTDMSSDVEKEAQDISGDKAFVEADRALAARQAYGQVKFEKVRMDQTPEAYQLRQDYEFSRSVRDLLTKLKDDFGYSEKMLIVNNRRDDEDMKELFEEGRKLFKKVNEEVSKFQADIMREMPAAVGMVQLAA